MEVKKIAVIGAGNMGHGIARTSAVHGFEVLLTDENPEAIKRSLKTIEDQIHKYFVSKGKMTAEEGSAVLNRLKARDKLEDAIVDADLVIEAIFEDLDIKKDLFAKMDQICPPHTILASNTSFLSITSIAGATGRADKVVGMHFFNPPDANPLLEIGPGLETSEETVAIATDVAKKMGKLPLRVKDTPGFIVNRFVNAIYSTAVETVQNGIANAEEVDFGVRTALGWGLGPCEMMDYSGIDLAAKLMGTVSGFSHLYLLQRMVDAGRYGMKNGKGFYDYLPDGTKKVADLSRVVNA